MQFKNKKRKGFTIVEVLIVVVIIGILAALIVPRMIDATRIARMNTAAGQHRTVVGQANSELARDLTIDQTKMNAKLADAFEGYTGTGAVDGVLKTKNAETTVKVAGKTITIKTKGVGVTLDATVDADASGIITTIINLP